MSRFIVDKTGEVTVITDTQEDDDICTVDVGCEDFAEWIAEALNCWYTVTDKYLQLSPPMLQVMRWAYEGGVTAEKWVDEQEVEQAKTVEG